MRHWEPLKSTDSIFNYVEQKEKQNEIRAKLETQFILEFEFVSDLIYAYLTEKLTVENLQAELQKAEKWKTKGKPLPVLHAELIKI